MTIKFARSLALAAALALPQAASAGTIVQYFGTEASGFLGFDSSLGTLTGVDISIRTLTEMTFNLQYPADTNRIFAKHGHYSDYLFVRDDQPFAILAIKTGSESEFMRLTDSQIQPTLFYSFDDSASRSSASANPISASQMADFVHDGLIVVNYEDNASLYYNPQRVGGPGGIDDYGSFTIDPSPYFVSYVGTVTYTYLAAVPEPANWVMLIVGFGIVGGALRQRRLGGAHAIA